MRGKNLLASGAMVLGVLAFPSAWAIDPATLANTGTGTIAACASCHGKDGGGQASFPRLAGMNATYLLKQLGDFDSGTRANGVMQPIAKALTPEERVAITNYYAAMPIPAAQTGAAPAPDPAAPAKGWRCSASGTTACPPVCSATAPAASASAMPFLRSPHNRRTTSPRNYGPGRPAPARTTRSN